MARYYGRIARVELGELQVAVAETQQPVCAAAETVQPQPQAEAAAPVKRRLSTLLVSLLAFLLVGGAAVAYAAGSGAVDWELPSLVSHTLTVSVNNQRQVVTSKAANVGELLTELGVDFDPEVDYCSQPLDQRLSDEMTLWVNDALRIAVTADGETAVVEALPLTVEQALALAGVELSPIDRVSLPLEQILLEDTELTVSRVTYEDITVSEAIEPEVVRQEFTYLAAGSTEVLSPGRAGEQLSHYRVFYADGEEIERVLQSAEITIEPAASIVGYGPMTLASRAAELGLDESELQTATTESGASFYYKEILEVQATAYTWTGNRTATGTWPKIGTIAVDPSFIPLGSKVYVVGYGFATAEDTGGAIKNNIIDLYMDTEQDCIQWGRRNIIMYVLE
ncbi:MAG: 3D domain-containing protein [Bacillota bacterium]|nr:3D domain-containing protein [Bacillota bacterium]